MLPIDRVRVRGWVVRYLPLEVLGTLTAVGSAWVAYELSESLVMAAVAGTLGEGVGYYALVVVRGVRGHLGSARVKRMPRRSQRAWATAWLTARAVTAEFGPAELVDTLLVRPAMLWTASATLGGNPAAWLVGKLAADVVFYAVAIASFELGRRMILPDGGRQSAASAHADASAYPDASARPTVIEHQVEGVLR